ncbi:MAG: 23S rRNA (guanosine(2251)-2'-O)-methyltransferase RlmB [Burkholderiaceae bacterium]|nr:23S rRNA (guanosine(2251)-2'-O)-methyltransferase RlmB [Burkholderiaceae bacterium]
MKNKILFGFHAVTARIRHDANTVEALYVDASRKDKRMQEMLRLAKERGVRVAEADENRLFRLAGTRHHQGVVAQAKRLSLAHNLDELLDGVEEEVLLLVLDSVTDPHNLGACLRVADSVGAHGVIVPRDRSVGLNATVAKVASGAENTVPYIPVTNLARALRELKERGIRVLGTAEEATQSLYETDLTDSLALIMGSEGEGLRRLTRETCDTLVRIPMFGSVESLNVSVASAVCLYEARRQRTGKSLSA